MPSGLLGPPGISEQNVAAMFLRINKQESESQETWPGYLHHT